MKRVAAALLMLGTALVFAHGEHKHAEHKHGTHKPPASKPVEGVGSLDVYRDGTAIHVLTADIHGAATTLWHRRSTDGGRTFSAPVRVDHAGAAPRMPRRGEDAQVAARGDLVVAVWALNGTGWGGSGPLASSVSADGGRTWTPGATPSDSGLTTGHGFADLLFDREGLHAVWLDSRDGSQGLRHALSTDGVRWGPNLSIQSGTCECCWNSLIEHRGQAMVLYRGKGPRDMALAARDGAGWMRRGRVGAFDWHFKGCPETGGALASTADAALHALVWTGKEGSAGLHHLVSRDGGAKWGRQVRLGGADAQHGDLAASVKLLAAVWDEGDGIYAAISPDGGATWNKAARMSGAGATATHPRVVAAGTGFVALWTEREKQGPWQLRTMPLVP